MSATPFTGLTKTSQDSSAAGAKEACQDAIQRISRAAILAFRNQSSPIEPISLPSSLFTEDLSHSALSNPVKEGNFYQKIDAKFFAHVFGDRDIEKTNLEGSLIQANAERLIAYIEETCPEVLSPQHVSLLKDLLNPEKTSEQWAERIAKLPVGGKVLMHGGWAGAPGHAMLYLFAKNENQNYDLYIYNTGRGIGTFHSFIRSGEKWKFSPIVYYKDVTSEELCLPKKDLIEALFQLRGSNPEDVLNKDPATFIYANLFGHLNGKRAVPPQDPIGVITGQRSGTCAYRVLLPLICQFIGDNKKYKIWHFEFQFATLRAFFQKEAPLLEGSEQNRLLLRNAAKNLQLSAVKLFGRQLISEPFALQVSATCREILREIDKMDALLRQERAELSSSPLLPLRIERDFTPLQKSLGQIKGIIHIPDCNGPSIATCQPPGPMKAPNPLDFPVSLSDFTKYLLMMRTTDPRGVAYCIEQFCQCLPLTPDYWLQIPEASLDQCLEGLDLLANTYGQIVLQPQAIFPQQQNTAQSLCVFVHQLAIRKDRGNLKDFGIDIEPFESAGLDPFCVFFEPEDFLRRQEILAYFAKLPQNQKLFALQTHTITTGSINDWKTYPTQALAEYAYFSALLQNHPLLQTKIAENAQSHKKIPEAVVRAATIIAETRAFRNRETSHAYILQNTALLAQLCSGKANLSSGKLNLSGNRGDAPEIYLDISESFSPNTLNVHFYYFQLNQPYKFYFRCGGDQAEIRLSEMHRFRRKDDLLDVVKSSQFKKNPSEVAAESHVFTYPKKSSNSLYEKLFQSVQCEPALAPLKLVYHFCEHITLVEDPDNQTLFDLILFKITKKGNSEQVHVFREIDESCNLSLECANLVRLGLDYYYHHRSNGQPEVFPALFFVRLTLRIAAIDPTTSVQSMLRLLDTWLHQGSYQPEELAAIHLHRAFAYTILLKESAKGASSTFFKDNREELEQLAVSWMITTNQDHHPHWKEIEIQRKIFSFLYDRKNLFDALFFKNDKVFNKILTTLGLDNKNYSNWKGVFPTYTSEDQERGYWSINFLTGKIANQQGVAKQGLLNNFTQDPNYIRLFQDERFHVQTVGDFSYFIHPQYGRIRILTSDRHSNPSLIVQKEIEAGAWWQYIPPDKLYQSEIPLVALSDYSHWMPLASKATSDVTTRFYDLKTKALEFEILANGEFFHKTAPLLNFHEIEENGVAKNAPSQDFLLAFEREDCLLITLDPNRGQNSIEQIALPRYRSKNGKTLSFSLHEGRMRWQENHNFFLVKASHSPQFFGNFSNLLLLEDGLGNFKALLPIRDLLQKRSFSRQCDLDVHDENVQRKALSLVPESQNGIHHYLEFDIAGAELIALCSEGRLFLAYLHFAQKEYIKAAVIIQDLPLSDALTNLQIEILLRILNAAPLAADHSPSSGAIRLHVALFFAAKRKQPKGFGQTDPNISSKSVDSAISDYEKAPTKIPEVLRLADSDWQLLRETFGACRKKDTPFVPNLFGQFKIICDPKEKLLSSGVSLVFDSDRLEDKQNYVNLIKWEPVEPDFSKERSLHQFFSFFYKQALEASNERDRLLIAHQINLFCQFNKKINNSDTITTEVLCGWLHLALRFPKKALPLLDKGASVEQKLDWILRLRSAYITQWKQDGGETRPPPSISTRLDNPRDHSTRLLLNQAAEQLPEVHPERIDMEPFEAPKSSRLSDMATAHMVRKQPQSRAEIPPLKLSAASELTEEERGLFLRAIETEFDHFEKDFYAGKKLNRERFEYEFNSPQSIASLEADLNRLSQVQTTRVDQWKKLIEALANCKPRDDYFRLMKSLLQEGDYLKQIQLEDCVNIFCRGSIHQLQKANPDLSAENICTLMQLTQCYLIDANELAQAKRAKNLLDQIKKRLKNRQPEEETSVLIHQLGVELNAQPQYCPSKHPQMLVFEYRSDLRMRKNQVELIERICTIDPQTRLFNDAIIQLMMGGGKTSVIASIVLMLNADGKHIPIFIAPSAQYESLRKNLGTTQKHNFSQTLRAIDLPRSQFTLSNLLWIRQELEKALELKDPVLLKSEKVQALQLEYLFLLNQMPEAVSATIKEERGYKIQELARINFLIWKQGRALWDEVDLLMKPTHETNFPIGNGQHLTANHVSLLKHIFATFFDETIQIDGRSIHSLLGLKENQSSFLSIDLFREKIAPAALEKLSKSHEELLLFEPWHESFVRYTTGQMQMQRLTQSDRDFLGELERRHNSLKEEERDSADLICLTKHLFCQVLPLTLQKSAGRHFGRSSDHPSGKIVPYLGVGSPASTEFGDPWEAAIYHFMTAACRGIAETQIEFIARALCSSAEHSMRRRQIPFEKTPEAAEFFLLTKQPLSQITKPGVLKQATAYVNQDIKKVLSLEAETICECVVFYPSYLSSNPQDFSNQFPQGNRVGLSGTPFNFPCYPKSLSENVIFEEGVDGRIVEEMIARAQKSHLSLFTVDTAEVGEIIEKGFNLAPKKEIRGIIDASGIFKDFDNESVAREIQKFLDKQPTQIDTILFFGRRDPADVLPDHLMALRKGIDKSICIGSTRKEELLKLGITPEQCFVFYDERHCEATDIAQAPTAVNIMTADNKITLRSISQGALRLRGYFIRQNIIFAVPKAAQRQMLDQGASIEGIIRTAIKNQAIQIARDTFRAYKHRLRGSVRQCVIEELLKGNVNDSIVLFEQCKELFISTQSNSLFDQYFQLEIFISPIDFLKSYREKWISLFSSRNRNPDLLRRIEKETNEVITDAERSRFLPLLVPSSQSQSEELEINVELQKELVIEVEREQELNIELQTELQKYMSCGTKTIYKEEEWSHMVVEMQNDFPQVLIDYVSSNKRCPIFALNHMMAYASKTPYLLPYHKIFSDQILVTKNWALTIDEYLPVFHPLQKPAHQILVVVKNNKLRAVLLSIQDAAFFKSYLSQKAPQNMWLILPDKSEISSHDHVSEEFIDGQLDEVLIEVNFFNGNARYLDSHPEKTAQFLKESEELKHRFLKLKIESDKQQKAIYYRSDLLNKSKKQQFKPEKKQNKYVNSLEKEQISVISPDMVSYITDGALIQHLSTQEQIQRLSEKQIPFISLEQVPMLSTHQLRHLPISRPELINAMADDKLSHLTKKQIQKLRKPKVEALQGSKIAELSLDQIPFVVMNRLGNLTSAQIQGVSKEQIPMLESTQLQFLVEPEQIKAIPAEKIPYPDMPANHVAHLSGEQIAQIPNANIPLLSGALVKRLQEPEKVQYLTASQLSYLEKPQLIQAVSLDNVHHLTRNQFAHLTPHQLEGVPLNRLSDLPDHLVRRLKGAEKIQSIHVTQINHIAIDQFQYLSQNQIKSINPNLVQHIQNNQIQYLDTVEQIAQLSQERLIYTSDRQAIWLLSEAQNQQIKQAISTLPPDKYKDIVQDRFIATIPERNYRHMTSQQIRLRFGGPTRAISLALQGVIGIILKIVSLFLLLPLFAYFSPTARKIDDQLTDWARKLPIAARVLVS